MNCFVHLWQWLLLEFFFILLGTSDCWSGVLLLRARLVTELRGNVEDIGLGVCPDFAELGVVSILRS